MQRTPFVAVVASLALLTACTSSDNDPGEQDSTIVDADGGTEAAPAVDEPFGRACQMGSACPKDQEGYPNLCVSLEGATAGQGFCTRSCNAQGGGPECYGVPNGQWAACMLGGPKKDGGPEINYCVFLCESPQAKWTCPPTQRCAEVKDGYAFCLP